MLNPNAILQRIISAVLPTQPGGSLPMPAALQALLRLGFALLDRPPSGAGNLQSAAPPTNTLVIDLTSATPEAAVCSHLTLQLSLIHI